MEAEKTSRFRQTFEIRQRIIGEDRKKRRRSLPMAHNVLGSAGVESRDQNEKPSELRVTDALFNSI
jgi:hypothetical protein